MGSPKSNRLGSLWQLASLLAIILALSIRLHLAEPPRVATVMTPPPQANPEAPAQPPEELEAPRAEPVTDVEPPAQPPAEPEAPKLDEAAVAAAQAVLDEAGRDRARAEARTASAERKLEAATNQAALDAAMARKLAFRIRDPSTKITQVSARGAFLKADMEKLKTEVATLRTMPRPKAVSILTKSPVAKATADDEFHFELRKNRISFVNLNRLLELAKSDAQVRIRMADRSGMITSQVGPVGAFSLEYMLGRSVNSIDELIERHSIRFDLKGWEIVPESEQRGETYEATRNPISEYTRAVNRLQPGRSVITFWVYPDSFTLYRRLRHELMSRGYSVAGRPLPDGMTIRGSPMGSQSAAQ